MTEGPTLDSAAKSRLAVQEAMRVLAAVSGGKEITGDELARVVRDAQARARTDDEYVEEIAYLLQAFVWISFGAILRLSAARDETIDSLMDTLETIANEAINEAFGE